MNKIAKIVSKLKKNGIKKEKFLNFISSLYGFFEDPFLRYSLLIAQGLPLEEKEGKVFLKTSITPINAQDFTITDIETTGSNPKTSQLLEICAIKIKNFEVIDKFEKLVYAKEIPSYISKMTGIEDNDVADAPKEQNVLKDFKSFLGNSVFVAHNVKFDFGFLSFKMDNFGYGKLYNRKICTIKLAKKVVKAKRYGLQYLGEELGFYSETYHRAYVDTLMALKIFKYSLKKIPPTIKTTEQLIDFTEN